MGVYWKIRVLKGVIKNQNIEGNFLKRVGAWTVFRFKGGLGKKRRVGWYLNAHYGLIIGTDSWFIEK